MQLLRLLILLMITLAASATAVADPNISRELTPGVHIPDEAKPSPNFDVERATQAYLDLLTPEQRAMSDEYFEGRYWVDFFGMMYGLVVGALLLFTGTSVKMRNFSRRVSARAGPSTMIYVLLWLVVGFVLWLPWSSWTGFVREHEYGLATQTYVDWLVDQVMALIVPLVLGVPVIAVVYAAIRRAGARWWIWAGGITLIFAMFVSTIEPVFISPIFNDYKQVADGPVREAVLSLARANQIPTKQVVYFDASRQTTRVSANVSGFAGTTQVSLNDNLLNKTSLPEIRAIMGHEMGHYVLNHGLRLTIYLGLLFTLGFLITHLVLDRALRKIGARLGLEGRADPAALPLFFAIFSLFCYLASPVQNTIVRQAETEADMFGLNAAGEPHGFATVAMRLSTYRKLKPGPIEEILFYDHPSGWARVHGSMLWLKEHPNSVPKETSVLRTLEAPATDDPN